MASTYTDNAGIEKPGSGDQAGTWGVTTNTNFDIIDRSLNGVGDITLSAASYTLTTSDGSLSEGGYRVLVLGGTPAAAVTITIDPNDQQKVYLVNNGSGQSVTFTQGTGGNITITNGASAWIYADGGGATAQVRRLPADLVDDLTPQLGGNLSLNSNDITGTGNINITGTVTTSGTITAGGTISAGSNNIETTGTVKADIVEFETSGWTIEQDGSNNLIFEYNGSKKMKLTSTGDLTVSGNITAYGTP